MTTCFSAATLFAPVPARGLLRLTGRDRVAFLHNMTTSHVKRLQPGDGQAAAIVDQRAQVIDWGGVFADPAAEALWITTAPGRVADVAAWLDKYLITEDVAIADLSADLPMTFLTGAGAGAVIAQVSAQALAPQPGEDGSSGAGVAWSMTYATVAGHATRVFSAPGYGGPGYLLAAEPAAQEAIAIALAAAGAIHASGAALEAARVAAGVPAFGAELGGRTNPWEARLEGAIALDKGCYLGQEVVARLHAYDKVQRLLIGLELPTGAVIAPGDPLFAGDAPAEGPDARPLGEVTSVASSGPGGAPFALALVKRSHAAAGSPLEIRPTAGLSIAAKADGRSFWTDGAS